MKYIIIIIILLFLTIVPASATELMPELDGIIDTEEIERAVPESAQNVTQDIAIEGLTLNKGIKTLFNALSSLTGGAFKQSMGIFVSLLGIVILCSMIGAFQAETKLDIVNIAAVLAISVLTVSSVQGLIGQAYNAIEELDIFTKALLPSMTGLSAAMGQPTAAIARHSATLIFSTVLVSVIKSVLFPMVYTYIILLSVNSALPKELLSKLAGLIKTVVTSVITITLTCFVTYLGISEAISGSADKLAVKGAQAALSGAIPVVGGIISDASEALLVGGSVIRNSVGLFGLVAILGIFLSPFLNMGIRYLLYKFGAALVSPLADSRISSYLDGLAGAFGMILSLTATCSFLALISVISCILAGRSA